MKQRNRKLIGTVLILVFLLLLLVLVAARLTTQTRIGGIGRLCEHIQFGAVVSALLVSIQGGLVVQGVHMVCSNEKARTRRAGYLQRAGISRLG